LNIKKLTGMEKISMLCTVNIAKRAKISISAMNAVPTRKGIVNSKWDEHKQFNFSRKLGFMP
jgi:hypothetical protein